MLLFSTLLEINDTMTKDSFIQLVLEWNQGSPHEENIIQVHLYFRYCYQGP